MLEKILNTNRIKFAVLDELFKGKLPEKKGKTISVHIDLHSILEPLYISRNYEETSLLEDHTNMIITSCIINIAAHYRLYFNKQGMCTRIYLYFGDKKPRNNCKYLEDYGYNFFDKYTKENESFKPVNKEVFNALDMAKIVSDYIEGVYVIKTGNIDPMNACGYMISHAPGEKNLVISKDDNWFQLVSLKNTEILRLKRDDSFILDRDNVVNHLISKNVYENKHVTHESLSVIYSFGGVKSRDIKGLSGYGYAKIIKTLDMAINRGLIQAKYTQIKNVVDEIYSGNQGDLLNDTFRAVDLTFQLNLLTVAQKESLTGQLKDKFNRRDLLKLNQSVFTGEHSLMLEELSKGIEKRKAVKLKW